MRWVLKWWDEGRGMPQGSVLQWRRSEAINYFDFQKFVLLFVAKNGCPASPPNFIVDVLKPKFFNRYIPVKNKLII